MEPPHETTEPPAWRSQLRRQALAFAIVGLVVPPVAIWLLSTNRGPADVLELIMFLGFACGVMALPLGMSARPGQLFAIVVGTVDGILVLFMLLPLLPHLGLPPHNRGMAREGSAVASLRTINTAQVTYLASADRYGTLEELIAEGLVDSRHQPDQPAVFGYKFAVTAGVSSYTATAEPVTSNSGRFNYFTREDAVVRYGTKAPQVRRFWWLAQPSVDQAGKPVQ